MMNLNMSFECEGYVSNITSKGYDKYDIVFFTVNVPMLHSRDDRSPRSYVPMTCMLPQKKRDGNPGSRLSAFLDSVVNRQRIRIRGEILPPYLYGLIDGEIVKVNRDNKEQVEGYPIRGQQMVKVFFFKTCEKKDKALARGEAQPNADAMVSDDMLADSMDYDLPVYEGWPGTQNNRGGTR